MTLRGIPRSTIVFAGDAILLAALLAACSSEAPGAPTPSLDGGGRGDGGGNGGSVTAVEGCPSCTILAAPVGGSEGLAVDAEYVYWTFTSMTYGDFEGGTVRKVPIGGGPATTIASRLDEPVDVAVQGSRIYWTALATNRTINNGNVSSLPRDGGSPTILVQHEGLPLRLKLDDVNVYWTAGYGGKIMKLAVDGSSPAIALASNRQMPYGLAIDDANVYWAEPGRPTTPPGGTDVPPPTGLIMSVPKGGGEPTIVASEQANPYGMAVDKDYVYWVNVGSFGNYHAAGAGAVMKAPLGGGAPVVVVGNLNDPQDVVVDDQNIYYVTAGIRENQWRDGTVEKVPLNGGTPEIIAKQQNWPQRIVMDATHVYFESGGLYATPDGGRAVGGRILKAPK